MRQHVNPLAAQHQTPVTDADWAATFDDPTRPLVVDLGCGPGRFLLLLAKRNSAGGASSAAGAPGGSISGALASAAAAAADPRRSQHHDGAVNRPQQQQQQHGAAPTAFNYLGLEIRRPLVDRANEWAKRLGTHRTVAFLACNATISLGQLLASYPGRVVTFLIQYPDPHFKRRHRKRRIFQPQVSINIMYLALPWLRIAHLLGDDFIARTATFAS